MARRARSPRVEERDRTRAIGRGVHEEEGAFDETRHSHSYFFLKKKRFRLLILVFSKKKGSLRLVLSFSERALTSTSLESRAKVR